MQHKRQHKKQYDYLTIDQALKKIIVNDKFPCGCNKHFRINLNPYAFTFKCFQCSKSYSIKEMLGYV